MDAKTKKKAMEEARRDLSGLFESAKRGDIAGMEKVISRAEDKKNALSAYRDGNRRHVLHFTAVSDSAKAIRWVLEKCPELMNTPDDTGTTPLALAASQGLTTSCDVLLEASAALNADLSGATPLHRAAQSGNAHLVERLVKAGCDVNAKAKASGTPLHWASGDESGGVAVEALLELGADASATDERGLTPLILAAAVGNAKGVVALANAGADAGLLVSGGATVAHICADAGDSHALKAILNKCVNGTKAAMAIDAEGRNAADTAMAADRQDCLRLLEERGIRPTGAVSTIPSTSIHESKQEEIKRPMISHRICHDAAKANECKSTGNNALAAGNHDAAIAAYSKAIELDATNKVFYSNRAAALISLAEKEPAKGQSLLEQALDDTNICIDIDTDWPKGHFRKGNALLLLGRFEDAAHAFWDALRLDPNNAQLKAALQDAVEKGRKVHQQSTMSPATLSDSEIDDNFAVKLENK
mmetsp:Transcript_16317/g.21313  ORF Transcript_16317/g.21313 Transcript_16317/m.21313 type:complete len:474 (-) Transcript_16317:32-1453(-)